jgi:hypothetical protein
MHGGDIWGLNGGWKESYRIYRKFERKILDFPAFAINNVDKLELKRGSRTGSGLCMIVQCWLGLLYMDTQGMVRNC